MKYIGYENSPVTSLGGLSVTPDKTLKDLTSLNDIEGTIFPGGVERIVKPELERLVKKFIHHTIGHIYQALRLQAIYLRHKV